MSLDEREPRTSRLYIWASDPHARLGFNNDPASTTRSTAWLRLGKDGETTVWLWFRGIRPVVRIDRDGRIGQEEAK